MATTKKAKVEETSFFQKHKMDIIYSLLLIVALMVFLGGAFFGGSVPASDNLSSLAMQNYLMAASDSGEFPLWIPHIFSGMPNYASLLSTGDRWWDVIHSAFYGGAEMFGNIFNSDVARVALFYMIYGIGIYALMRSQKKDRYASFFASFAAVFSTGVIVWIMIGHNTKPIVMAMLPWIFMALEKLRQRFSLLYAVLLTVGLHIVFESTHVQMIFYAACAVGLYLLFELISRAVKKDNPISVVKTAGVLVLAGALAFIISSDRYLAVMEYTDYSTRGAAPLFPKEGVDVSEDGGNDYEYATQWSFSPPEMIDFAVPNYHGYGKLEYDYTEPKKSNTILASISRQQGGRLPLTYWSQKPFEDVPPYMGIIVLVLGFVGFWSHRRNVFAQFLMALSVFSLLLSFGYTWPYLYDIFYNYVPNFDKFRAPSMSLSLMQFSFPILAGYAVDMFLKNRMKKKDKQARQYKYNTGLLITTALFIGAFLIFYAAFKDSYYAAIASSKLPDLYRNSPQVVQELQQFLWESTVSDWLVNSLILGGAVFLIIFYTRSKASYVVFAVGMTLLMAFDLFRVSGRALEVSEGGMAREQIEQHRDWADWIKSQPGYFRVGDFVSPTPNATAYFGLHGINGYHSAKLRVYQDMLDAAAGGHTSQVRNPFIWNLTGTKYIAWGGEMPGMQPVYQSPRTGAVIYENPDALPRVFFVDSYEELGEKEAARKLEYIPGGNFNPREVAYITETEFSGLPSVNIDSVGPTASVEITDFANQHIKIKANATGNNLLFLSEVWYPEGWTTYIDGEETETYRTNFAFRSIVVPPGEHEIELIYESEQFEFGKLASMLASGILFAMLVIGIIIEKRKGDKQTGEMDEKDNSLDKKNERD